MTPKDIVHLSIEIMYHTKDNSSKRIFECNLIKVIFKLTLFMTNYSVNLNILLLLDTFKNNKNSKTVKLDILDFYKVFCNPVLHT